MTRATDMFIDTERLTWKGRPATWPALRMLAPTAILGLFYVVCIMLLDPLADTPFIDDWTYAWSVEHFLNTGELRVLNWSENYPYVQVLWGALFSLVGGFSFSVLRLSTVILAWLGALALYATLRTLGCSRQDSLIGTLVLLVNPVFFILTFSFMTDVPYISVANIGFFFVADAVVRQRSTNFLPASLVGVAACLARVIGVAFPVSLLLSVLLSPRHRRIASLFPVALASLLVLVAIFWMGQTDGYTRESVKHFDLVRSSGLSITWIHRINGFLYTRLKPIPVS